MNVSSVIYTAADESFVTCLDAKTGENVWTESVGGKYAASPVYAEGRVYLFDQDGGTTVIKPGRTPGSVEQEQAGQQFRGFASSIGKRFRLEDQKASLPD